MCDWSDQLNALLWGEESVNMKPSSSGLFETQSANYKINKCGCINQAAVSRVAHRGQVMLRAGLIVARDNHIGLRCDNRRWANRIPCPSLKGPHDANLWASPEESQRAASVIKGSKLCCCREAKRIAERWLADGSAELNNVTRGWEIFICSAAASVSPMFGLCYVFGKSFQCQYDVNRTLMGAIIVNGFPSMSLNVKKLPRCLQQSSGLLLTTQTNAIFMCPLRVKVNKWVWLRG